MNALETFSERKMLPVDFLREYGLSDEPGGIGIANGNSRSRIRKSAETPNPTFWVKADARKMHVFGHDRVPKMAEGANKTLLIAEGESDSLSAWYHKRPCLGVPGASMFDTITLDDVSWADRAAIVREPGTAGGEFVVNVAKRLRALGFTGLIVEITLAPHKDVSALHIAVTGDRKGFSTALDAAIAVGTPVVADAKPVSAPRSGLGVLNDDDLLALATECNDWLVEGLIRESGILLLSARPKVGKSELARNLGKAVGTGTEFLGRRCRKGKVVWVGLEETSAHLRERIEIMDLLGLGIHWVVQQPAGDEAAWLRQVVEQYRPDLVIIDTIARLLRIEDINHYSEVARATQIMLDLRSQYGVAFCAIHHNNRQDGTLGSVQWEAFCDTIMLLSRSPNGERFVKTVQRAGADMESSRLERDENTGQITIVESKLMSDQRAAEQRILRYASMLGRPATREELARHSGRLNSVGRSAVDGLVTGGLLVARGKGTRAEPRLYELLSSPKSVSISTSVSSLSTTKHIGEDSEDSEETFSGHSEETPMYSEDSEHSEESEESDAPEKPSPGTSAEPPGTSGTSGTKRPLEPDSDALLRHANELGLL